jgi:ATP-dependent RNA helicase A
MSGVRCSDQFAFLNAFNKWENARRRGEQAEIDFCDNVGLSMPMLRITWEAKVRLARPGLTSYIY